MNPHRASVTVPLPQAELFAWLCSVENWPRFLEGLEGVEPLGYRRYRWSVHYAGRRRTTDVVVSVDVAVTEGSVSLRRSGVTVSVMTRTAGSAR